MKTDKVFIKFFVKYLDYANIFLADFVIALPKYKNINKYTIKLVKIKEPFL